MPKRTALYRFFDASGVLLYVGITDNPSKRWNEHAISKRATWWSTVAKKTLEWYPSRDAADAAETQAINVERPLHNHAKRDHQYSPTFTEPSPEIGWGMHSTGPASVQVARILRSELAEGRYPPGEPFPSGQEFADRFRVSVHTVYKALRVLTAEGLIRRERPRGPFSVAS